MRQPHEKEFIIIEIKKHDIEKKRFQQVEDLFNTLKSDHDRYFQTLHFVFDGYNHDPREIFEIEAIRQWTLELIKKYPEVLFFMEYEQRGFQNIILCIGVVEKQVELGKETLLHVSLEPELYKGIMAGLTKYEVNVRAFYLMERVYKQLSQFN